jgi:hypothetical protein
MPNLYPYAATAFSYGFISKATWRNDGKKTCYNRNSKEFEEKESHPYWPVMLGVPTGFGLFEIKGIN